MGLNGFVEGREIKRVINFSKSVLGLYQHSSVIESRCVLGYRLIVLMNTWLRCHEAPVPMFVDFYVGIITFRGLGLLRMKARLVKKMSMVRTWRIGF